MKKFGFALATILLAASSNVFAIAPSFGELAGLIQKTKEATAHPSGTAVAVVKDGKIIYQGYFGYADIERKQPASTDAVFYIASATKPFFALNALLFADKKHIDTNTSLQRMFPDMQFNGIDAGSISAKNLLTHTSGVENEPLVWATAYSGIHDATSRRALLSESKANKEAGLGSFQYSNVGYNILSIWLDQKSAKPWQVQLNESIFKPLGMKHTSAYISTAEAKDWLLAAPYSFASAEPNMPLYLRKADNTMQAAGGLVSTAPDLAKFLIAQLNDGRFKNKQVFPKTVITQSHASQAIVDNSYLDFKRQGYAWGWYTGEYKGKQMLHHFGGFAGFHAHMSFIPESGIGLVVLNNEDALSPRLTNLIADYTYSLLLSEPDTSKRLTARFNELLAQSKQLQAASAKQRSTLQQRIWKLTLPIETYVGTYQHPLLGSITIAPSANKSLRVDWGKLSAIASAYDRADYIRIEFSPNSGDFIAFKTDPEHVLSLTFADATFIKVR
jgi:CubicO group peptidase (beta-lactamase class C family)